MVGFIVRTWCDCCCWGGPRNDGAWWFTNERPPRCCLDRERRHKKTKTAGELGSEERRRETPLSLYAMDIHYVSNNSNRAVLFRSMFFPAQTASDADIDDVFMMLRCTACRVCASTTVYIHLHRSINNTTCHMHIDKREKTLL